MINDTYIESLETRIEELEKSLDRNMRGFRVPLPGEVVVLREPLDMNHSRNLTFNRNLVKVLIEHRKHIVSLYEVEHSERIFHTHDHMIHYRLPKGTKMILCSYDVKKRRSNPQYHDFVRFQLLELPGVDWKYKKLYFRLLHNDIKNMNAVMVDYD